MSIRTNLHSFQCPQGWHFSPNMVKFSSFLTLGLAFLGADYLVTASGANTPLISSSGFGSKGIGIAFFPPVDPCTDLLGGKEFGHVQQWHHTFQRGFNSLLLRDQSIRMQVIMPNYQHTASESNSGSSAFIFIYTVVHIIKSLNGISKSI